MTDTIKPTEGLGLKTQALLEELEKKYKYDLDKATPEEEKALYESYRQEAEGFINHSFKEFFKLKKEETKHIKNPELIIDFDDYQTNTLWFKADFEDENGEIKQIELEMELNIHDQAIDLMPSFVEKLVEGNFEHFFVAYYNVDREDKSPVRNWTHEEFHNLYQENEWWGTSDILYIFENLILNDPSDFDWEY